MANSFSFNAVDFSTYGVTVIKSSTWENVAFASSSQQIPYRNLHIGGVSNLQPKNVQLECVIEGTSRANLKTRLVSVYRFLNHLTDKQLKIDDQSDLYINARFLSATEESVSPSLSKLSLSFTAYDPHWYSNTETTDTETVTTNPQSWIVAATGSTQALPQYLVKATSTSSQIVIQNATNDTSVSWANELDTSTDLLIDVAEQIVYTSPTDENDWTESMTNVTGFHMPALEVGNNSLTVTGLVAGSVKTTFRARWI